MSSASDPITELLERMCQGVAGARDELIALLYGRFRQRAHQRLRHERPGHSLGTSDLTNEALLRLLKSDELAKAADSNQLFRAFARAMRQVLIDHTRRHHAAKRGGQRQREELDDLADDVRSRSQSDLLSLNEALQALAVEYPDEARVLELQFFGGFETAELAQAQGVSPRTVQRHVQFGLAWLRAFLSPDGAHDTPS